MKRDIKSILLTELKEYFVSIGEKQFRAQQVFSWLHKGVTTFGDMTNLSTDLRNKLDNEFYITVPSLIEKQISEIDGTVKYLYSLHDSETVECVLMSYSHGNSICISTQVGCKMGCTFCASALDGFKRNLSASEMLDQVLFTQMDSDKRISNVVLMGIGEPLDNFDNVMRFIQLICHPSGMNVGARHITISTCGLVEKIDRLAGYDVQSTLAISLHAPDDETRSMLVPANRNIGVKNLIESSQRYFEKTGRRITYEYAMIAGINDSQAQAEMLSKLLDRRSSHLNLILLSNVHESKFIASTKEKLKAFTDILIKNNTNYTMRRSLGSDIDASCGQLRRRVLHKK
ncbi:MAG: 23S rRNA (adenine(2503)-C(2))-methyltransferase RlmN [Oscillospiraceae bacterium]|nr:23S rRNA (adenine(2503)-C(2))-methyltransferase RlmN [Oscillospiraceae bacterium]